MILMPSIKAFTVHNITHFHILVCPQINKYHFLASCFQSAWFEADLNFTLSDFKIICIHKVELLLIKKTEVHLPSLRHCLRIPPLDMFFSCSSSLKLILLANTSISVIFISRCRNDTACSIERPWLGSSISTSPYKIMFSVSVITFLV